MSDHDDIIFVHAKPKPHDHLPHGTWKVAYADFVTAMMAFFILLWLLNSSQEASLSGLSQFFAPENISDFYAGQGKIGGGHDLRSKKPKLVTRALPAVSVVTPTFGEETKGEQLGKKRKDITKKNTGDHNAVKKEVKRQLNANSPTKITQTIEILKNVEKIQENIAIEKFPEGFKVQVLNLNEKTVLDPVNEKLTPYGQNLLFLVGQILSKGEYNISVEGHTSQDDQFDQGTKSSWTVSSNFALDAQRVITQAGMPPENIIRVMGKSFVELIDFDNPLSDVNNRISITLIENERSFEPYQQTITDEETNTTIDFNEAIFAQ